MIQIQGSTGMVPPVGGVKGKTAIIFLWILRLILLA
jgi:hypothetical protein